MRALHQTLDGEPKILSDPVAPRLIDPDDDREWLTPLLEHPFARQWRAGFALRARYAEDCLAERARAGDLKQYVILGAGLDTFAYRQPEWARILQIYEVDESSTQNWKRERLTAASIAVPSNTTFVTIDFEKTSIPNALESAGLDRGVPTVCSWMGVTQYLTPAALDGVFAFVLSLPRSSEIVFSFIVSEDVLSGVVDDDVMSTVEREALALAADKAADVGEPWLSRFHPGALVGKLQSMGFSRVSRLTPEEAHDRYFANRDDGLLERRGEQLMRAVV
jgi:methyltransferase (TIGR00027 family)